MRLINNCARLIDINYPGINEQKEKIVAKARLLPAGGPVDVPDIACRTPFVRGLLRCGDLVEFDANKRMPEQEVNPQAEALELAKQEKSDALAKAGEAEKENKELKQKLAKAEADLKAKGK